MMTAAERFLEVLCRPFAGNREQVLATHQQLSERLASVPEQELQDLTERLAKGDTTRKRWKRLLAAGVMAAIAAMAIEGFILKQGSALALAYTGSMDEGRPVLRLLGIVPSRGIVIDSAFDKEVRDRLGFRFSASEAMRFGGDPRAAAPGHSHSTDPTQYFADVEAALRGNPHLGTKSTLDSLPADFVATGEAIDPGNGWYRLRQGADTLQHAFSDSPPMIHDPAAFAAGMRLFSEAGKFPRCESPRGELLRYRATQLPVGKDAYEQFLRACLFYGDLYRLRFLDIPLAAVEMEARNLATAGDRDGLSRLSQDWLSVSSLLAANSSDNIGSNDLCEFVAKGSEALAAALHTTGQHDEAGRMEAIRTTVILLLKTPSSRESWLHDRTSGIAGATEVAELQESSYEASRKAYRAIIDRILAWEGLAIAILGYGLLSLAPFGHSQWNRSISKRLPLLLTRKDWLAIVMVGIGVPALLYAMLSFLTPLGCRDYGDKWLSCLPYGAQAGGAVLLSIAILPEAALWRLSRHLPLQEPRSILHSIVRWIPVILCTILVIGAGCLRYVDVSPFVAYDFERGETYLYVFGLPAFAILLRISRLTFSRTVDSWHHPAALWVMQRGLLVLSIALIATIPLSIRQERRWIAQDPLFTPQSSGAIFGPAYHDSVAKSRQRIADALAAP